MDQAWTRRLALSALLALTLTSCARPYQVTLAPTQGLDHYGKLVMLRIDNKAFLGPVHDDAVLEAVRPVLLYAARFLEDAIGVSDGGGPGGWAFLGHQIASGGL
jgi:hypothetical protein